MATKNGSRYLGEQIRSILVQLAINDELVICDDASTDSTRELISKIKDDRIRLITRDYSLGIVATFEEALNASRGDIIFLADQDDVWLPSKLLLMSRALATHDLVICQAEIVGKNLEPLPTSFQTSKKGFMRNLFKNTMMGCCMAFRREVHDKATPFPKDIPMHDLWLGIVSHLHFNICVIPDKLVLHRRHEYNATTTGFPTRQTIARQFLDRYKILKNLITHRAYAA